MDDADSDLNEDNGTMDINAAADSTWPDAECKTLQRAYEEPYSSMNCSDMGREMRDQKDYNRYLSYFECDISGYDIEAFQTALVRQRGLQRARHWYYSSSQQ
ncbi:hypothetical protein IW262DRAFT_1302328 [Armillaria fumosa]|nr:hypothetical protein IW262DRAFT_1302328 [Armillaria fumosa]